MATHSESGAVADRKFSHLLRSFPAQYMRAQLLGWLLYAVLNYVAFGVFKHAFGYWQTVVSVCLFSIYGLVLTHLLRIWMLRNKWEELTFFPLGVRVFSASILFGLSMSALVTFLNGALLRFFPPNPEFPHNNFSLGFF